MSRLDFPHTCPTIDQALRDIDGYLNDALSDLIDEVAPLISDANKSLYLTKVHKNYFEFIKEELETLRDLNSDMRDKANDQLDELIDDNYEKELLIHSMEIQIDELETEVTILRDNEAF